MIARRALAGLPLLLAACGLSERPYAERRQWPLTVPRPTSLPPRRDGRVLEVRSLREGPGLVTRGLQTLQPDGSLQTAFYEEWAVPPAQGVEEALRAWLLASGKFAAVVAPGSRVAADLVLEGELTALLAVPAEGVGRTAMSVVLLDARASAARVVMQRRIEADARLDGTTPADAVRAQLTALAEAFGEIERLLA